MNRSAPVSLGFFSYNKTLHCSSDEVDGKLDAAENFARGAYGPGVGTRRLVRAPLHLTADRRVFGRSIGLVSGKISGVLAHRHRSLY
jgi:hypothetical protein